MMATPSERPPELEAEHEGITELVRGARVDDPLDVGLHVEPRQHGDAVVEHHPDGVGHHDGVVRLRVLHRTSDDHDSENCGARDDTEGDVPYERASSLAHLSRRRRGATWRTSRSRQ